DTGSSSAVWRRRLRGAARRILGPDLTHDLADGARRVARGGARRLRRAPHALARPVVRRLRAIYPSSLRLLAFNVPCVGHTLALEPDVILCHDLNTLATGVIAKRLTGRPLLYDSHELFLERNLGARSRGWDRVVWGPVEWLSIGRCDAVFTVAEGIARHLARQYGITRPKLIRNVQPYEPPAPRTTLLADELDVPADHAIVLYPGAITVHRGLEELIDSAPYLQRAVYVIMGYARNPAYLESLRERARRLGVLDERVRFRDAVPINDVVRYTGSADLGIVPTQRICLSYEFEASNKIFHCLMAGVPLAMSNHIEKRMLVERHGIGVLFDETDPRAIAQAVNDLLGDDAVRRRMRAACLEAARTLNWEREEHTLRSVFKDLLGDRVPEVPPVRIAPRSTPASPSTPPPLPRPRRWPRHELAAGAAHVPRPPGGHGHRPHTERAAGRPPPRRPASRHRP
ncbi:MAG: glycosyltransferase, partial [Phycisphaerales bacterium]|nr:glycosyltransferase [Phycisphaerales bacterium]